MKTATTQRQWLIPFFIAVNEIYINPKHEKRNPKKIQILKIQMFKTTMNIHHTHASREAVNFGHLDLGIVSIFDIRISIFFSLIFTDRDRLSNPR